MHLPIHSRPFAFIRGPFTLLFLLFAPLSAAGKYYVYAGQIDAGSVLLAWGATDGSNTIGRSSRSHGPAEIRIDGHKIAESTKNWVQIQGLQPDHDYPYEVWLNGAKIGSGAVRTYPARCDKLAFVVMGDFGNGQPPQYAIARAIKKTIDQQARAGNPVRFILSTGDNIYADQSFGFLVMNSGDKDSHWEKKFFRPYEQILRSVPFYPVLGNHDGGESESTGDLAAYLDNFFFPAPAPARFYSFSVGGLADFYALDSTNIRTNDGHPIWESGGAQYRWLQDALARSRAPWKIAWFHHPPFTAGPLHAASLDRLKPYVDLLGRAKVHVVFSGHEHNFQWSERNDATGGVRYVVSGAGGQLRSGDVRAKMASANIAAWAPEHHFLLVEIEDRAMKVRVLGDRPVSVRDKDGKPVTQPFIDQL